MISQFHTSRKGQIIWFQMLRLMSNLSTQIVENILVFFSQSNIMHRTRSIAMPIGTMINSYQKSRTYSLRTNIGSQHQSRVGCSVCKSI